MQQEILQEKTNVYKNKIPQLKTMQLVPPFRLSQIIKLERGTIIYNELKWTISN